MIKIKKSLTADTRSCPEWSKVTKEQLLESTQQHIGDVAAALSFFSDLLCERASGHDYTKIADISRFHNDFIHGFDTNHQEWWNMHKRLERHHLAPECVGDSVTLIDILEHICDCVMAGKARSGSVYPIKLSDEQLQAAVRNTQLLLERSVEVEE